MYTKRRRLQSRHERGWPTITRPSFGRNVSPVLGVIGIVTYIDGSSYRHVWAYMPPYTRTYGYIYVYTHAHKVPYNDHTHTHKNIYIYIYTQQTHATKCIYCMSIIFLTCYETRVNTTCCSDTTSNWAVPHGPPCGHYPH